MSTNGNPTWLNSEAGIELQSTLSQEKTLQALNRLLQRLDSLEHSVSKLTEKVQQGPGMLSMMTDMADEAISSVNAKGINFENRLQNLFQLADRLSHPETTKKLETLLGLADQLPGMTSMVTDMVDEGIQKAQENNIDIESRLHSALSLVEKLTEPETGAKIDQLLQFTNQAPGLIAMTVDMVDEVMLDSPLSDAKTMLNPQTLAMLGKVGDALAQTQKEPVKKVSLMGFMRASRNPDLQKALGFLAKFGENFGKKIQSHS